QYSFCIALAEALSAGRTDHAAVPRWLAAVVERGRAADPGARFASMRALLDALARDPARRRRRWALLAGTTSMVAAAAIAFLASRRGRSESELCEDVGELASVWPAEAQARALARIASLGAYGHQLARELELALRDHAVRWVGVRRDACLAHHHQAESD